MGFAEQETKIKRYIDTVLKWFIRKRLIELYMNYYDGYAPGNDYAYWLHNDITLFLLESTKGAKNIVTALTKAIERNKKIRAKLCKYGMNSERTKADLLWFTAYFNRMSLEQVSAFEYTIMHNTFNTSPNSSLQYFKISKHTGKKTGTL